MGMTQANCKRENIARAALEAAIFGMRAGLEAFKAKGFKPREIRIIGGGAKSRLWRQIAADIMNLPVKRPLCAESGALGGALQALWCLEVHKGNKTASIESICAQHINMSEDECAQPNPKNVELYNTAYNSYNMYLNALSPLYIR
jgi:xylulokinase